MASKMSFFRVPLACEAAPGLGCGTIARPVLTVIERQPGVRQAWLSREGTVLGILWADEARYPERVISVLQAHGMSGVELKDREYEQSSDSFAGGGWYRPVQLEQLSAEEARLIALRLVRRLEGKKSVTPDAAERLAERLEEACARALGGASPGSAAIRREQIASALRDAAKNVLDAEAFQAFAGAVSLGHRPLPGER